MKVGDIIKTVEVNLQFGGKFYTHEKHKEAYRAVCLDRWIKNKLGEITEICDSREKHFYKVMFIILNKARTLMYWWDDLEDVQMVKATDKECMKFLKLKKRIKSQEVAEKI